MKARRLIQKALIAGALLTIAGTIAVQGLRGTPASPVSGNVILAAGDVADCEEARSPEAELPLGPRETEQLLESQPGIILGLGDMAYEEGELNEYRHCFNRVWGSLKQRIFPVPGNHEYKSEAVGYRAYWGNKAGPGRLFYSFDYAGWHLVALNSEIDADPGSEQAQWLEDDLNWNSARCILAFFHRPAFSARKRSNDQNAQHLFGILYRHGASLVLSAHNHFYERTAPLNSAGEFDQKRGLRQFVVGTGGAELDRTDDRAGFTEALIMDKWGILRLDLEPDRYKWTFLSAPDGIVEDSGESDCVKPVKSTLNRWQALLTWISSSAVRAKEGTQRRMSIEGVPSRRRNS